MPTRLQVNVMKNSEWAYDEYLRPETQTVAHSKPDDDGELSEVLNPAMQAHPLHFFVCLQTCGIRGVT